MRVRAALLLGMLAILGGCAGLPSLGIDAADADSPPFPECRADAYAFAGRGTLAGLGLVGQSKAELPEPNRAAMIWVTRDPVAFDAAEPGGSRMLCFEFEDGSGGSEWPVSAAWQPPGTSVAADVNLAIPVMVIALLALTVAGALAFRRR